MKIGLAIEQVADAERELARALFEVGERHKADHDVFHVSKTLADNEQAHIEALAEHGGRYDAAIDGEAEESRGERGPIHQMVEKSAELVGSRPEPALLLLGDLRQIYLLAAEASINWVMLAQGAQAAKDTNLLETVSRCHDETLQTLKWAAYRVKTAAPQALVT